MFYEDRINNDLRNLSIPLKYELSGLKLNFKLKMNTPIYKGTYNFELTFTPEYPFESPKLKCLTRVYHPNIDSKTGSVCLSVLRLGWRPCFDINSIVVTLIYSFEFLSGDDAINTDAGDLFESDYDHFVRIANAVEKGQL